MLMCVQSAYDAPHAHTRALARNPRVFDILRKGGGLEFWCFFMSEARVEKDKSGAATRVMSRKSVIMRSWFLHMVVYPRP